MINLKFYAQSICSIAFLSLALNNSAFSADMASETTSKNESSVLVDSEGHEPSDLFHMYLWTWKINCLRLFNCSTCHLFDSNTIGNNEQAAHSDSF